MTVWYAGRTLHTRQSSIETNKYQVSHKYSCFSWWWAHRRPKHVKKRNKRTKKLCTKLALITSLYRDARSTEHKIQVYTFYNILTYLYKITNSKITIYFIDSEDGFPKLNNASCTLQVHNKTLILCTWNEFLYLVTVEECANTRLIISNK
jgi:hypothetical protein